MVRFQKFYFDTAPFFCVCPVHMYEETKIAVFTKPPFNKLYFEAVNRLTCIVEVTNSTLGKQTTTSLRLLVILLRYCR